MAWIQGADNSQLEMGKKVELEHRDTIQWLVSKLGPGAGYDAKVMDELVNEVATKIASDHLRENSAYYTKLLEAKL